MVLTLSYINFHSCSWICLFPQPPRCALIIQHLNQPSTCFFLLCQWKLFSINYKTHSLLRFSWLFFISGWKCQFTVILFCLQKYPVYQLYCRTHSLCESACKCVCELVNVWACKCICKIGNACAYMCICRKDMEMVFELARLNVSQALFSSLNFNHFLNLKIFIIAVQMISGYKAEFMATVNVFKIKYLWWQQHNTDLIICSGKTSPDLLSYFIIKRTGHSWSSIRCNFAVQNQFKCHNAHGKIINQYAVANSTSQGNKTQGLENLV